MGRPSAKRGVDTGRFAALLAAVLAGGASAQTAGFGHVTLLHEGADLVIFRLDGRRSPAPKLDHQTAFAKPAISPDRHHVGWLALYPDQGASYAQPLELVVQDDLDRTHRFAGAFGMVFGWCFATDPGAVTLTYSFSHGRTPVAFETRRIGDGAVLRHFELSPSELEKAPDGVAPPGLPRWASCAWASAHPH